MRLVCITHKAGVGYPIYGWNPDEAYPEYPFGTDNVSTEPNAVYRLVRDCLAGLGLDKAHFGRTEWNPLGEYIRPGDFVLVKPNFVMHKNENSAVQENAFECLITHPACIRAICDYCLIALRGTGRLLIGDAPMQGCDFAALLQKSRLAELTAFYRKHGFDVAVKDFRQYESKMDASKVIVEKRFTDSQGVTVHLGDRSTHCGSDSNGQYQVSDYDKRDTQRFHHGNTHDYEINREALEADVIINFCKPKTHRLAGFTGAMKNMVGITYNKASLPHRTAGSVEEHGDAYLHKNMLKRAADGILTAKIRAEEKKHLLYATFLRYVYGACLVTARKFGKDSYYIGSWYGNDTIWRTICDLNYIVRFADKQGNLCDTPQRTVLSFGDMIVAGERNGPVSPQPKQLGCIMGSADPVAFDATLCKLMGFEQEYIPLVRNLAAGKTALLYEEPEVVVYEKGEKLKKPLTQTAFDAQWRFEPHDAWK